MPIKKAMIVLGLVCVVAPALASAAFIARQGAYSPGEGANGPLAALIGQLQAFIDGWNAEQEVVDDGYTSGVVRLPFRKYGDRSIDLTGVYFAFDAAAVDAAFGDDAVLDSGMVGGVGGGVGALGGGTPEQGGAGDDGSMASSGGVDGAVGMGGGIGGVGSGGSAGGGGEADGLTELAMDVDSTDGLAEGPDGETLLSMPLPASVWMLMASMIGLAFIGYRRRHHTV